MEQNLYHTWFTKYETLLEKKSHFSILAKILFKDGIVFHAVFHTVCFRKRIQCILYSFS